MTVHFDTKELFASVHLLLFVSVDAIATVTETAITEFKSLSEQDERCFNDLFITKRLWEVVEMTLFILAGRCRRATKLFDVIKSV